MKKLFVLLAAAAMFVACEPKQAAKVTVEDLASTGVNYVGQEVEFTGSVAKACPNSGCLLVVGTTPDAKVQVLPVKDAAFEGVEAKEISVKGTVTEVEGKDGAKAYAVQAISYEVVGDAKCPMAKAEGGCCSEGGDKAKEGGCCAEGGDKAKEGCCSEGADKAKCEGDSTKACCAEGEKKAETKN